jgi:hypothetical protein
MDKSKQNEVKGSFMLKKPLFRSFRKITVSFWNIKILEISDLAMTKDGKVNIAVAYF